MQVQQEKTFKIHPKNFDDRGNMIMDGFEGMRGNELYKQPPVGWIGIGLTVFNRFDRGNEWLGTDEKSWPVAYHACKNIAFNLPQVIQGNYKGGGLRPEYNNAYVQNQPAIYCSPDFHTALGYSETQ